MKIYHVPYGVIDVTGMIRQAGQACVSIYMPVDLPGAGGQQNHPRLRGLLELSVRQLGELGHSEEESRRLLAELYDYLEGKDFRELAGTGLALFATEGYSAAFELATRPGEQVAVGADFLVRPLLAMVEPDFDFYILAVNLGGSRLYEADRHSIRAIDLGATVGAVREYRVERERAGMQQHGASGEGSSSTRYFGYGEEDRNRENAVTAYLEELGGVVDGLLAGSNHPLLLAGEASVIGELRPRLKYGQVMQQTLNGNPREKDSAELHAQAMQVLGPFITESRMAQLRKLRQRQSRDGSAVADDPGEILAAAHSSNVDTLYITPSRCGVCNGVDDPANLAASLTLATGGTVQLVADEEIPGPVGMLAGLRY